MLGRSLVSWKVSLLISLKVVGGYPAEVDICLFQVSFHPPDSLPGKSAFKALCSRSLWRPLGVCRPVCKACTALTAPLQSLTTSCGWHSSKAQTTARNSALYTDCLRPGSSNHTRSCVSV
eukprot:3306754-Amphidinium_carterae.1